MGILPPAGGPAGSAGPAGRLRGGRQMANLLTLDDLGLAGLSGKRVFVRVDFNVPISGDHKVLDATRIEEAIPTIRELSEAGCIVILASHLGRPKGQRDPRYTLLPVTYELERL